MVPCGLVLLFLLPLAAAHGPGASEQAHLNVRPVTLDPGASATYPIETGEGPWIKGMVFVVYVVFFNESRNLDVSLVYNDTTDATTWTGLAEERNYLSARIPYDDGPYDLRFTNRADHQVRLLFYFDQTCNCSMKPVPLKEGWVVFGYDLKKGHRTRIAMPLVATWTVEGSLTTLANDRARFPDDFHVVDHRTASGPHWLNFTVDPPRDDRYVVFLTVHEGSPTLPDPKKYVSITPLVEDVKGTSPAAGLALLLLASAVAVAWARRDL